MPKNYEIIDSPEYLKAEKTERGEQGSPTFQRLIHKISLSLKTAPLQPCASVIGCLPVMDITWRHFPNIVYISAARGR